MAGNKTYTPPDPDQIEISIFGPGFGECIVVHLGNAEWAVIDSCISLQTQRPVALDYFEAIGIDHAKNVKLVVATHYHDDHMGGLGQVMEECASAKFACSIALNTTEWVTLVETYRSYLQNGGTGVDELRKVMEVLRQRSPSPNICSPKFAMAKIPLFERSNPISANITALSPSDAAVALMHSRILNELLPNPKRRRQRVPTLKENDSSVVLSVRVGATSVLLGADLEERGRGGIGWQAVIDDHQPTLGQFEVFKIPHHGSKTGFHPQQWPKLVSKTSLSTLTPYNRGNKLPTEDDCNRILANSDKAYITAPPGLSKFKHPNRTVQKAMTEATLQIGEEFSKQGHIQLRRNVVREEPWSVELFGDAVPLQALYA